MQKIKTSQIRQSFLDFFARHDHQVIPSSPVIPHDDPTILFTNAGMNQFKDVFTGKRRAEHPRATTAQKCIRAGGKHNDLDNVGFTARHHTFFEMLGSFSFGDYFKEEAIAYAWEWVTRDMGLPRDRLYATVYETDDEAYALWSKVAPELKNGRILRFGKHDNYWSMGDLGPNGPCSEIHFDRGERYGVGPQHVVNGETDRFIEIWNLVFMQFDQLPDGRSVPLPRPSVDTGAGLERLAAILQGADTNYGIDIFLRLIEAITDITGSRYEGSLVTSHRVIADHVRALTFAIADGAGISNEGQGYVLRRILRRAARHGRLLGMHEPFISRLVPVLVDIMGEAYPEIREKQSHVEKVIRAEEESFGRTLETGLQLFDKVASSVRATGGKVVPGEEVFRLYDTYGFPYDLTEIMASEQKLTLDQAGFDRAMKAQQEKSKAGSRTITRAFALPLEWAGASSSVQQEPVRDSLTLTTRIARAVQLDAGESGLAMLGVVLEQTPFYTESGGQASDSGVLRSDTFEVRVIAMQPHEVGPVHIGELVRGTVQALVPGAQVEAEVDPDRRWDTMRHHTATHLAHAALRKVLGEHVKQSGSYVGPDRLRFDFSHHQPMTPDEIAEVERLVNEQILRGEDVDTQIMDADAARKSGAMALFGEKYGSRVRVVSVPGFSKELCGGTHVANVSQIGPFFITMETGIASGVRRIEAITGREAVRFMLDAKAFRARVAATVGRPEQDALDAVEQLRQQVSALQKEVKTLKTEMFSGGAKLVGQERVGNGYRVVYHDFGDTDRDTMAGWIDTQKNVSDPLVALALGSVNGKPTVVVATSDPALKDKGLHAGNLASKLLPKFGGRGGGKPNYAQGSVAPGTGVAAIADELASLIGE